jgi:outer membrane protein assembly factor BamD
VTRTPGTASATRPWAGLLLAALAAWGCGAGTIPPIHSPAERLSVAKRLAGEGDCVIAIDLLKGYIAASAGSADVDEAIYFLGECYMKTKDYASAAVEYERLLRDYPESDSAAAASFRLGDALFGQTRPVDFDQEFTVRAIRQWDGYLRAFPGHWRNEEARERVMQSRMRLAQKALDTAGLYVKLKLYDPARVYYQMVIDEYGDTPKAGEAFLGLARCDALEGKRDRALERYREIEDRFAGTPVAIRAAEARQELEH